MRFLTTDQKELLRLSGLRANLLATIYFDEGTMFFCDDVEDLKDGDDTYIGANALLSATDIRAGAPLSAEGVTITIDGTRAFEAGITDPAFVFKAFLDSTFHQRRFDLAWAFSAMDQQEIGLIVPAYAGKINNARLVDDGNELGSMEPTFSRLEITLDALASRYKRRSFRTRSNEDQLQLTNNTDKFFSYVAGIVGTEESLYWGRAAPTPAPTAPALGFFQERTGNFFGLS